MLRLACRKILPCSIAILFAMSVSACPKSSDWIQFRGKGGRGAAENPIDPPLAIRWKIRLQENNPDAQTFNPPIIVGNSIYFGSNDGNFYNLDINTGYMKWVYKTEAPINSIPYADGKNVYFGSNDKYAYALNRKTGEEYWRFYSGSNIQSTFFAAKDYVVFTGDQGFTHFVNMDGEEIFSIPNPDWLYHTFQVDKDILYFAPGPEEYGVSFSAFDIKHRTHSWVMEVGADPYSWYSFPAIDAELIHYGMCGSDDTGAVFEFRAISENNKYDNPLPVWTVTANADFGNLTPESVYFYFSELYRNLDYLAPAVGHGLVVYNAGDRVTRAFDKKTGAGRWTRTFGQLVSSAPTIAGDKVYFGLRANGMGQKDKLVCLSLSDGKLLWETDLEGTILSAPVIAGKWIVFGTSAHYFYVLEKVL
jgi:outer membrane protein assembly factor BamB